MKKIILFLTSIAILATLFFMMEWGDHSNEENSNMMNRSVCGWMIDGNFTKTGCFQVPFTAYGYGKTYEAAKRDAEQRLESSKIIFGFSKYGVESTEGQGFECGEKEAVLPSFVAAGSCSEELDFNIPVAK